jgi:hypothetical protein
MTPNPDPTGPHDPLERFEADLRSLRPRTVSPAALCRTAERLGDPAPASPGRTRRVAGVTAAVSAAAALVAAAATIGLTGGRPGPVPVHGPGHEIKTGEDAVTTPGGCECRVRFTRVSPARPGGAGAARSLDHEQVAALGS